MGIECRLNVKILRLTNLKNSKNKFTNCEEIQLNLKPEYKSDNFRV